MYMLEAEIQRFEVKFEDRVGNTTVTYNIQITAQAYAAVDPCRGGNHLVCESDQIQPGLKILSVKLLDRTVTQTTHEYLDKELKIEEC